MTKLEYQVLSYIHINESAAWVSVLNAMQPSTQPVDTDAVLHKMLSTGIIEKNAVSKSYCYVHLTEKGISLLLEETDRRLKEQLVVQKQIDREQDAQNENKRRYAREKADRQSEQRTDRIFQVLLVLLGALVTNIDRIIPWLISFFR